MTTKKESFSIALSDLDQERFGHITAKAFITNLSEVQKMLDFCKRNQVRFLIIRCPTNAYEAIHYLTTNGMPLLDTLIYYDCITKQIPTKSTKHNIRFSTKDDAKIIRAIAKNAFQEYPGHYFLDPKLDQNLSQDIYQDWAERSTIDKKVADHVFVSYIQNIITGFLALKIHKDAAEITLNGVSTEYQKQGIYTDLVISALSFAHNHNINRIFTSTQLPNLGVQKTWIKCGMMPYQSYHTFHHWL